MPLASDGDVPWAHSHLAQTTCRRPEFFRTRNGQTNLVATRYNLWLAQQLMKFPLVIHLIPLLILSATSLRCLAAFGSFDEAYSEGKSRFKMADYTEAQNAFNAALEMAADSMQRNQARAGLADCLLESQDGEGCRELAEEMLADFTGQPSHQQGEALKLIAESFRREKRHDEMLATIDRANNILIRGLLGYFKMSLGAMCYREGLWDQSIEFNRDALASDDRGVQVWAYYWLARTARATGQTQEALEYLDQINKLGPDNELINKLTKELAESLGSPRQ
jgi:tetratricopeptide (TPR) repeat protein